MRPDPLHYRATLVASTTKNAACAFCQIAHKEVESPIVFEDDTSLAFLDHRPLFVGHCVLIPKRHHETLLDLPEELIRSFFANTQLITRAVEEAVGAEGSFVAINNRVSQSVPHLHVHIVPRRKGDGLKGFFWPRQRYKDIAEIKNTQEAIRAVIRQLRNSASSR